MAPRRVPPLRSARWLSGWIWAALALFAGGRARAQAADVLEDFGTTWWNINNGLPQSSINAMAQGPDGELWLATYGGLVSFDGVEFHPYDLETLPGLRSNRVTSLAQDGAGGVWFATEEGSLHHLRAGRLEQSLEVPGGAAVLSLLRAPDGTLWTQSGNGAVHRFAADAWTELLPPGGAGEFRGLCLRDDGVVAAAHGSELVLFEPAGLEGARLTAPAQILSLAPDHEGGLWVGLRDGVARARGGEIQRFESSPPLRLAITALLDDGRGTLWLGTVGGIGRLATESDRRPEMRMRSSADYPLTFLVRSLLLDLEGNLWLGGADSGLLRLRPLRFSYFPTGAQIAVTALCDDGDGGAWVGYQRLGLAHLAAGTDEESEEPLEILGRGTREIHSLLRDQRGRTWVGVNQSCLRREPGEGQRFEPVLSGMRFQAGVGPMVAAPDGDVWLSTQDGRLLRIGADDTVREERDLERPAQALAAAADGSLWIGVGDQVLRLRGGELARFGPAQGLPAGSVRDLLPEPDGGVWVATYGGGIALLSGERARKLSRSDGLFDNSVTRILVDGQDRFWILTNLALMVVPRRDVLAVLAGRSARVDPVVLGPEAGMNEASFGSPAGFRDGQGRLWFGLISGAARIDAERFPFNRLAPKVRIRVVRTSTAALRPEGQLEIPPGWSHLEFDFTAYALSAPQRARFRYRLEGYDEDWIDGGTQRQATYTALAPGPYTFRVTARNEDGVWSAEPQALRLELLPAWWQTPAFRVGLGLAALFALLALHRLRIGIVERHARQLLDATEGRARAEERSSRLREELAHVARVATAGELASSLAHEVNQPLAAIVTNAAAGRRILARGASTDEDMDAILRDIGQQGERASQVIRRLRQFLRKHETVRSLVDVGQLVHETLPLVRRELEDHEVALELQLSEGLPPVPADSVQLQQVLVNVVKNACDAMAAQPGPRRLLLRVQPTPGGIALEVHDSGPGIAAEVEGRVFQPYVTTKPSGMGLGLAICRTIVEAHAGRMRVVPSELGGAAFRVELPAEPRREA